MATLPFTGEITSDLPFCGPATAVEEVELPDAEDGEKDFFVALA